MRTNPLQVAVILMGILLVILIVVIVMMNQGNDKRIADTKSANERADKAEKEKRDLTQQLMTIKGLIGHEPETDLNKIQTTHQAYMEKEKIANEASRTYISALTILRAELDKKNAEHKKLNEDYQKLQADYNNLEILHKTVTEMYKQEKDKADNDRIKARSDYKDSIDKQKEETDKIVAEKAKTEEEAQKRVKDAETKAENSEIEAKQRQVKNEELVNVIEDLRRTNFERPDGKIISVSQQSGTVFVNLGSEDGLMTRMTFSVYSPSITGISFGSADPESEVLLCDVCKRERSLNTSKASIEIIQIHGPHKAEGRILDDILTDPIVAGDVVYTPIWKPGQKQHFALASGMRLPGIGRRDSGPRQSDLKEIIRLIRANGGEVDSYISDGDDKDHEEDNKRGDIVGNITRETTFIVIGDLNDEDNQDQVMMEAQSQMVKTAEQYAVKKINLRELLSRMGWKNVTPVRGFGDAATESDLAIVPTGENRSSTGIVSPIYQKRNEAARISVEDRTSRPSTGIVSGLYSNTPATVRSTGQTSELFKPRKPAASQTKIAP
ncbi:MAG: hypothetical protein LBQ50_14925 [Planctomycetaceae bacterium]|jgi:hypothetical protein|nr:hypothetical protein [Planctomycetaceae bacterium]